ncbi:MAG: hypothetical protein K1000chlam3_00762 [Chlamydiae bacterium]|nr:hypothetical protein [Chlamydiota bacterium]
MRKIIYFIICFSIFCFTREMFGNDFGYISYSSSNIGDDIQAIAAKRFLPENSIPIDREFLSQFQHCSKVSTIVNGWFMHTPNDLGSNKGSKYNWPPSSAIDPLLISMHFTQAFVPFALSPESCEYFKEHGPVGARDYFTLQLLQSKNIPSYFSGCITLTLDNSSEERDDIIYAVDIGDECVNFIRSKTKHKVEVITHQITKELRLDNERRLRHAEKLLDKYKRAKCVITSRLHAAMPCLGLETPVLLINIQGDQYRFDGLRELVRNCTLQEFLNDDIDFNFDEPSENPNSYIPIRENLIEILNTWVAIE